MSWAERANELLYDGETVRETVDVGANRVFVTSHRLLVFFPEDAPGPNFRQVDNPNVEGASASIESDRGAVAKSVLWGVVGLAMVVGGVLVEVRDLLSLPDTFQDGAVRGAGGLLSMLETVFTVIGFADEALAALGVGLLAIAGFYAYRYQDSREHVVTVAVAGDEDVRLAVDADGTEAAGALERALGSP